MAIIAAGGATAGIIRRTGKSQVWKTLYRTYYNQKKKPHYNDLEPKAVTNDELFGIINPATREWKDGLFSVLIREQANMGGEGSKWMVLDGDIDPMWIESLNTVMDDNKVGSFKYSLSYTHVGHGRKGNGEAALTMPLKRHQCLQKPLRLPSRLVQKLVVVKRADMACHVLCPQVLHLMLDVKNAYYSARLRQAADNFNPYLIHCVFEFASLQYCNMTHWAIFSFLDSGSDVYNPSPNDPTLDKMAYDTDVSKTKTLTLRHFAVPLICRIASDIILKSVFFHMQPICDVFNSCCDRTATFGISTNN
ncbi:hypothetical protein J6590_064004 [Homalodisca vitripennis]|nr:hypothetical protein J6590_064004 [Homalodisca vitripennis]